MAIHYDPKLGRFRDGTGRLVSKAKAMRSSIARREYEQALQKKPAARPTPSVAKVPAKVSARPRKTQKAEPKPEVAARLRKKKDAAKAKPIPPVSRTRPKKPPQLKATFRAFEEDDLPPWMREGVVREYPRSYEWFPTAERYGYDELDEDWGEYDDDETTSGGDRDED